MSNNKNNCDTYSDNEEMVTEKYIYKYMSTPTHTPAPNNIGCTFLAANFLFNFVKQKGKEIIFRKK